MRLKMVDGVLQVTFTTRYARARMFDTMSGLVGGGSSKSQPSASGTGVGAEILTFTNWYFGAEGTKNPIVA
jgi:hypothetical protein